MVTPRCGARLRPGQRPESGAIGLQVVLLAAVAAAVVLVVAASAGSVLVASGRAQDAADAAALAAARAGIEAGTPRAAATAAASTHGATVVACACTGPQVRVTVSVPVAAPAARALGITEQRASAAAQLVDVGSGHVVVALRYSRIGLIQSYEIDTGGVMASTRPVRVDSEIVAAAEQTARWQHRSTAEQVNRWARLGKHLDLSMSVDQRRIERFLAGDVQFRDLTDEERAAVHAGLDADLEERAAAVSFGQEALREGVTVVAIDDQGELVETSPDGSSRTL